MASKLTTEPDYCPFHKGPIVKPCRLKKCDLWVKSTKSHCLLTTLKHLDTTDTAKINAIAQLFGLNKEEAVNLINEAHELLKVHTIQQNMKPGYILNIRKRHCVVCGKKAKKPIEIDGVKWCSEQCLAWLPPQAVLLENKFGHSLRDVLFNWRNLKVTTLIRLTDLKKDQVIELLWQHLGKRVRTNTRKLQEPPNLIRKDKLLRRIALAKLWHDNL